MNSSVRGWTISGACATAVDEMLSSMVNAKPRTGLELNTLGRA